MGLAAIDPHSKQDAAIGKCQNLQRKGGPSGRCPTKRPDGHTFC